MKLFGKLLAQIALLGIGLGVVQIASGQSDPVAEGTVTAPVAFVYVSSSPSGPSSSNYQINEYTAAANGKLTAVANSPYAANVQSMALNGKWLFGTDGANIYSFLIAADGALTEVSSINAQALNTNSCGGPANLFLDHTGATLYDEDYDADCANNAYQYFTIDQSSGQLTYLGVTSAKSPELNTELSFIGNNLFAYGSSCYHFNSLIFGFTRNDDGTLTELSDSSPMPAARSGEAYCPYLAAADTTSNVAVSFTPLDGMAGTTAGHAQLGVYTADGSGSLTTASNYSNMPPTLVGNVIDLSMAPSGKLLAVAGSAGLQVFHFNGDKPVTHYTGLLSRDEIDQIFWDDSNHLYAISRTAGKLFVFTVTPTSEVKAAGSPYSIANPENIIVLPKK
jgi:hypothetical protein